MGFSQIIDVDVVADARAIGRRIIRTEYFKLATATSSREKGQWNEMGFGMVQFANFSTFIGAGSIEIAEAGELQAISAIVRLHCILKEELTDPVGIDRLARRGFRNRHFGGHAKVPIPEAT